MNARTANLLTVDPAEGESGGVQKPARRRASPNASFSKPRRTDALPEKPAGVQVGDVPVALLPPDAPVTELVKVGEVCGQEVFARRSIVDAAARLRQNLGTERNWPGDALLATILALRIGARMTYREIAESLNMSERHVLRVAKRGKKDQVVEREIARLDREGMPMAVENVLDGLQERDKDYTLEFLKGRGVFKQKHEAADVQGGALAPTGLIVQFIHNGEAPQQARAGSITATPNRTLAAAAAVVAASQP